MKKSNFVMLKKKAIERFFGKNEHAQMYCVSNNLETMTSEEFVEYVSDCMGFYGGETAGFVSGQGDNGNTWKVTYFSSLLGKWQYGYFNEQDLKVIKIDKVIKEIE